nr:CSLREA domain-containing protein [uncultured Pseudomonas sp.]
MFPSILPRVLSGTLLLAAASTSQAAVLLVTTAADSYDGVCNAHCSLRDAVAVANQAPNADTILLPAGNFILNRPPVLDSDGVPVDDDDNQLGDLDVLGELRIRGRGTTKSHIKGQFNERLIEVRPGARLLLEKLVLEDGNTAHNGGALENHGQLQLNQVLVQHNQAQAHNPGGVPLPDEEQIKHGHGGGIANYGDLRVLASRFQENNANGSPIGDANGGRGGALFNQGSALLRDSLLLRNSTATENPLGMALYNLAGSLTVERTSIVSNGGGELGFFAVLNDAGELMLSNSTLSGNVAGGVYNLPNSQATLSNVTLTATSGVGLRNAGDMQLHNSVIAGNLDDTGEAANCYNQGSLQATGLLTNLEGQQWNSCSADYYVPLADTFTQVLQFPLSKQNSRLWFHALPLGSPAIDAGIGDCLARDQRGVTRPQDGNGDGVAVCDLGAYELKP